MEYYDFFHSVVFSGICCGLEHPLEWVLNYWRTPGATMSPDYYTQARKLIPRLLVELYEATHMKIPEDATAVLKWFNAHWEHDMFIGIFDSMTEGIAEAIGKAEERV